MRRKNVRAYLSGETEQLQRTQTTYESAEQAPLQLRPEQLARYVCEPAGISITSFARRLMELKDENQDGTLTGRQLSDRLLQQGLLTEAISDTDDLLRRPTPAGEAFGIRLEERINAKGERYSMVVLTEQAQRRLLSCLSEPADSSGHISEQEAACFYTQGAL